MDIDRYIAYPWQSFLHVSFACLLVFLLQILVMSTHPPHSSLQTKRIAAIDLGTNSFHALIVDLYEDGRFDIIDTLKEMVLLAEDGVTDTLSDAAMGRGIDALRRIKTLTDHREVEEVVAYATSAIRESKNGGTFIQRVIDELGIKIQAISGRMEAELIGIAVQHGVHMTRKPALIMDIGGGSVEFIIANHSKTYYLTSKKLGVARMRADHWNEKNDPMTAEEIQVLQTVFGQQLQDVAQAFAHHRANMLIGSSGTMQNIGLMIAEWYGRPPQLTVNELSFTAKEFFTFYKKVIEYPRHKRAKLKGLEEKRIDLIVPGLILVNYVLKTFSIKTVKISAQALREGIILRYLEKELPVFDRLLRVSSPRLRTILELVEKYDWHEVHSRHVAMLALRLFDEFKEDLHLSNNDRELLEYAALTHDIGYHISHKQHHKHALYMIRNSRLRGFKEWEIEVIANVARYHRKSIPKSSHEFYHMLSSEHQKKVRILSGFLRVADGLDRSHYQNVRDIRVKKGKKKCTVYLTSETDPHLEIWGAERKCELFEEATGRTLKIKSGVILHP